MGKKIAIVMSKAFFLVAAALLPLCAGQFLGGVSGSLGTPQGAPRLLGASMVEYNNKLYIFGGLAQNQTNPSNKIFLFDLKTREWQELTPSGEERPLGRMFHTAYIRNNNANPPQPEAMIVYGGINCFQSVVITSEEQSVAFNTWSNNAIEYKDAMEDIWYFDFASMYWLEMRPLRTRLRGVCPPIAHTQAIKGAEGSHWQYGLGPKTTRRL